MATARPGPDPPEFREPQQLRAESAKLKAKAELLHRLHEELAVSFRTAQDQLTKTGQDLRTRTQRLGAQLAQRQPALEDMVAALEAEVGKRTAAEDLLLQYAAHLRTLASRLTLAEQQERRRVADVLHNDLQQIVVGARFRLHELEQAADPAVRKTVCEVVELLQQALHCSHSLAGELSPPILRQGHLLAALEWLCRWMGEKYGFSVDLRADAVDLTGTPDTAVLLTESIRELLLNVMRHAHTQAATVEVRQGEGQVHVQVSDEGVGFDPAQLWTAGGTAGGFGLFTIRERLELLGGGLKIESAPGQGSHFTLSLPYHQPAVRAIPDPTNP